VQEQVVEAGVGVRVGKTLKISGTLRWAIETLAISSNQIGALPMPIPRQDAAGPLLVLGGAQLLVEPMLLPDARAPRAGMVGIRLRQAVLLEHLPREMIVLRSGSPSGPRWSP
jgi:hypothetical protein